MLYRYLAPIPIKATPLSTAAVSASMRREQAMLNGDHFWVAGPNIPASGQSDSVSYFSVSPDGTTVTYGNRHFVQMYDNNLRRTVAVPVVYLKVDSNGRVDYKVSTNNSSTTDWRSVGNYHAFANNPAGKVDESTVSNYSGTLFSALRKDTISGKYIDGMRYVQNNITYSDGSTGVAGLLATSSQYRNVAPHNSYLGTPVQSLLDLPGGHTLVGYFEGGAYKWDIWTPNLAGSNFITNPPTRAWRAIPSLSGFGQGGGGLNLTLKMVTNNLMVIIGDGKANSYIYNGDGSFTLQSSVPLKTTASQLHWICPISNGRWLLASATSSVVSFNAATGFSGASHFEFPSSMYAASHSSGNVLSVSSTSASGPTQVTMFAPPE